MVGCSLRHRGEELLGQRGGLRDLHREALHDGDPAAAPLGEPRRAAAVSGRRPRRRPRLGCGAAPRSTRTGCRSTVCSPRQADGRVDSAREHGRRRRPRRGFDFAGARGADGGVPVPARGAVRGEPARATDVDRDDDRPRRRRGAGADLVRLPPLPAAARRRSHRMGGGDAGARTPRARWPHAPHRRAEPVDGRGWSARLAGPSTTPTSPRRTRRHSSSQGAVAGSSCASAAGTGSPRSTPLTMTTWSPTSR